LHSSRAPAARPRQRAPNDPSSRVNRIPLLERATKLHGRRLDSEEKARKKAAREGHKQSENAQNLRGLRAKLYAKERHHQKIQMRKQIKQHEERNVKGAGDEKEPSNPVPAYLLDRANPTSAKALRYVARLWLFWMGGGGRQIVERAWKSNDNGSLETLSWGEKPTKE